MYALSFCRVTEKVVLATLYHADAVDNMAHTIPLFERNNAYYSPAHCIRCQKYRIVHYGVQLSSTIRTSAY